MTRLRTLLLAALILASAAVAAGPATASAQAISVSDEGVTNSFPDGLRFNVSARADQPIQTVRLRYAVLPDGSDASGVPEFQAATSLSASFALAGPDTPNLYLPPGTRVRYHWEVKDAAGNVATSPEEEVVYEDVRFDWTTLEADGVVVHYYSGSEEDAQAMLDVAQEVLAESSELLGAAVEFPVNVRIYRSVEDMRPALQSRSASYEERIITAGVRVSSDTVLVLGNASFSTLRHELTHVVTGIAGEGPFGSLPAWLDEGTAVYAQGDPEGFGSSVQRAIDRGNVLSVRSITSYQGDPEKVNLFYGQSWSLVSYLVNTYGEEKFAQLFAEIKAGNTTDSALETVYGFDQDGLDNEWRVSVGLPPRENTSPDNGDKPVPTLPPSGGTNGGSSESGADGGTSAGVIVGLAVGLVAVAAAIGFATVVVGRRFR